MTETLFKDVRYDLNALIKFIELGEIGLPDIQRPFVWKNIKIRDPRIEMSALKTIAGFLNTRGGTLIIGCNDSGEPQGLEADQFANEDKMYLHLVNLVNERIGPQHMMYIHPRFEDMQERRVLVVECWPARSPACLKDNNIEKFFIRTGASTTELSLSQMQDFVKQRFSSH